MLKPFFYLNIEVDKHHVKKNSRNVVMNKRTGRMFPIKNKELRDAEEYLIDKIKIAMERQSAIAFKEPVWAVFTFRFPKKEFFCQTKGTKGEPIGRRNSKIPDLSNLYEHPQDCLQMAGVILNDSQIDAHDGSRRIPSEEYRLEIRLYAMP